jgi:hypothetical protein
MIRVELYKAEVNSDKAGFDEVVKCWADIDEAGIVRKGSVSKDWNFESFTRIKVLVGYGAAKPCSLSFAEDPIRWALCLHTALRSGQPSVRVTEVPDVTPFERACTAKATVLRWLAKNDHHAGVEIGLEKATGRFTVALRLQDEPIPSWLSDLPDVGMPYAIEYIGVVKAQGGLPEQSPAGPGD